MEWLVDMVKVGSLEYAFNITPLHNVYIIHIFHHTSLQAVPKGNELMREGAANSS